MFRGLSVARRLRALVALEALVILGLLLFEFEAQRQNAAAIAFLQRFVVPPFESISAINPVGARLTRLAEEGRLTVERSQVQEDVTLLRSFLDRYDTEWNVLRASDRGVNRFRRLLLGNPRGRETIERERGGVAVLRGALDRLGRAPERRDVDAVRTGLRTLLDVNVAYLNIAHEAIGRHSRDVALMLLVLGTAGLSLSVWFGTRVRNAIVPRMRHYVEKVRRFQETGEHEREPIDASDEIGVLGAALDAGFDAIATRDRERDEFLAVVAHEIKTPLASIVGFTQAALDRPKSPEVKDRALAVVQRSATRLSHIVEDLLLAAASRSHKLALHPRPIDLAAVTNTILSELKALWPGRTFDVHLADRAPLLGDEDLLSQGLWGLLSYAGAAAPPLEPVHVTLDQQEAGWVLEASVDHSLLGAGEIEQAFSPFSMVQHEVGAPTRFASGLYLCREVASLHGGRLRASEEHDHRAVFTLELPA
jgi:signal transduction histidine kinase